MQPHYLYDNEKQYPISISGGDISGSRYHTIAYCLTDNTNGYTLIGGIRVTSVTKTMVLNVPADSGLTIDGVLPL